MFRPLSFGRLPRPLRPRSGSTTARLERLEDRRLFADVSLGVEAVGGMTLEYVERAEDATPFRVFVNGTGGRDVIVVEDDPAAPMGVRLHLNGTPHTLRGALPGRSMLVLVAGGGSDLLFCRGRGAFDACYVNGGTGDDLLVNTGGASALNGGDDANVYYGGAGPDEFNGGSGDELFFGNGGDDGFWGYDGNDRMWGGDGGDHFYGHSGTDELHGGTGNDLMLSGPGADVMWGGDGNDSTNEVHIDMSGVKSVWELDPDDQPYGGPGLDLIGLQRELMDGSAAEPSEVDPTGEAALRAALERLSMPRLATLPAELLAMMPVVDVQPPAAPGGLDVQFDDSDPANPRVVVTAPASDDIIHVVADAQDPDRVRIVLNGVDYYLSPTDYHSDAVLHVLGGAGYDVLVLHAATTPFKGVVLDGGDDDDALIGSVGSDTLLGGAGDDLIIGGAGDDLLDGGAGYDIVHGDGGNDRVHGGDGFDLLWGGDGNDNLFNDAGGDSLHGDAGDDVFHGTVADDGLADFFWGGDGSDVMNQTATGANGEVNVAGMYDRDYARGGLGLDFIGLAYEAVDDFPNESLETDVSGWRTDSWISLMSPELRVVVQSVLTGEGPPPSQTAEPVEQPAPTEAEQQAATRRAARLQRRRLARKARLERRLLRRQAALERRAIREALRAQRNAAVEAQASYTPAGLERPGVAT
jgi:Ca2+-binding RTX toxin-like protein